MGKNKKAKNKIATTGKQPYKLGEGIKPDWALPKSYEIIEDYSMLEYKILSQLNIKSRDELTTKQLDIVKGKMTDYSEGKTTEDDVMNFLEDNLKLFENNEDFYTDTERCSQCKGGCCKKTSCAISPDDLKEVTYDTVKDLITKKFASIDWYDRDDTKEFFLRTREVGKKEIDPSYGGVCSMLTDTGCKLDWSRRPKGGRLLRTTASIGHCVSDYNKESCAKDWLQYSSILISLVDEYRGEEDLDDILYEAKPEGMGFGFGLF